MIYSVVHLVEDSIFVDIEVRVKLNYKKMFLHSDGTFDLKSTNRVSQIKGLHRTTMLCPE